MTKDFYSYMFTALRIGMIVFIIITPNRLFANPCRRMSFLNLLSAKESITARNGNGGLHTKVFRYSVMH